MRATSFYCFVITSVASFHANAQSMNAPNNACLSFTMTYEVAECFGKELKDADKELNKICGEIQRALQADESKSLVTAQRLWIQFRDATCRSEVDLFGGGSAGSPTRLACLDAETRTRILGLKRSYWWRVEKSKK